MARKRFGVNIPSNHAADGSFGAAGNSNCGSPLTKYRREYGSHAGVGTSDACYGLPAYCGWQLIGGSETFAADATGTLQIAPTTADYFEPKAVYMFAVQTGDVTLNARFVVNNVSISGSPQLAAQSGGGTTSGLGVYLSDFFGRPDSPLLVDWEVISNSGLTRPLDIQITNITAGTEIEVYAAVWGNALSQLQPR
jgi:hypothetical protein